MLTDQQINLVQSSFASIAIISDQVARTFYARLFEIDPSLRRLFRGPLPDQGYKLMQMIGTAVMGLDRIEELMPAIEDLGRRHMGYGVEKAHYDTVGEALLWTLEAALGDEFTPELRDAWAAVYGVLAGTATAVYDQPEGVIQE
jgi:hemoglobin-like flavoprotein